MAGPSAKRISGALALTLIACSLVPTPAARAEPSSRIVGGQVASKGEFPWMATLIGAGAQNRYRGFYCGGSLIAPRKVLTAAHCVTVTGNDEPQDLDVVIGSSNLSRREGRRFDVRAITVSPRWTSDFIKLRGIELPHDIAILHLARASRVKPLQIIGRSQFSLWEEGANLRVIGFGLRSTRARSASRLLRVAEQPRISDARCEERYRRNFVPDSMLCAGTPGQGSCNGDSGGPLIAGGGSVAPRLVGIVSYGGRTCAGRGSPTVYTRIERFRSFISDPRPKLSPVNKRKPGVRGRARVGSSLTCTPGAWRGKSVRYRYVWGVRSLRRVRPGVPRRPVFEAVTRGRRLNLRPGFRGDRVACAVIAFNGGGAVPVLSEYVGPVRG